MHVRLYWLNRIVLMIDLELDVEEEENQRGIEPPAYWPSRDSKVEVDNLTCHYAPQVRSFAPHESRA